MNVTAPPLPAVTAPPAPAPSAPERRRGPARLPWLVGAAALSLAVTTRQLVDPDVWWHLGVGRIILDRGIPSTEPFSFAGAPNPWIGQQWLYEVGLARLIAAGGAGLAMAVMGIVAASAFLVAALATRRGEDIPAPARAASLLLCCLAAGEVLGVRGQVVTVLGTALVLLVVTRWRDGSRRAVWALPPLFLVWANLHAGFVAGLALALAAAATVAVHRRVGGEERARVRPLLAATGLAGLATLVNPAGPRLWGYVVDTFSNPTLTQSIVEWQSPDFHSFWPRVMATLVIGVVVLWALGRRRPDPLDAVLLVAAAAAWLQAQRNVALLAIVLTPQLARYATAAWRAHRELRPSGGVRRPGRHPASMGWVMAALVAGATVVTVVLPATAAATTARNEREGWPAAAATWVGQHRPGARLYSLYEWGGYLAQRFPGQRVVWIYGESAVFGDQRLRDYLVVHDLETGWQDMLARNGMHDAVLPVDERETVAMLEVGWTPLCYDVTSGSVVLEQGPQPPRGATPPDPRSAPSC
jgi:hypothetical protein